MNNWRLVAEDYLSHVNGFHCLPVGRQFIECMNYTSTTNEIAKIGHHKKKFFSQTFLLSINCHDALSFFSCCHRLGPAEGEMFQHYHWLEILKRLQNFGKDLFPGCWFLEILAIWEPIGPFMRITIFFFLLQPSFGANVLELRKLYPEADAKRILPKNFLQWWRIWKINLTHYGFATGEWHIWSRQTILLTRIINVRVLVKEKKGWRKLLNQILRILRSVYTMLCSDQCSVLSWL